MNAIRPSCDCCGIYGGYIADGAKTIIPAVARTKLSFRLVPDQNPEKITECLRKYLASVVPEGMDWSCEVLNLGSAWVTDFASPWLKKAQEVSAQVFSRPAVLSREGASIPIVSTIQEVLKVPVVMCGMGWPDDGIHSPHERFSLRQYRRGAEFMAQLLAAVVK